LPPRWWRRRGWESSRRDDHRLGLTNRRVVDREEERGDHGGDGRPGAAAAARSRKRTQICRAAFENARTRRSGAAPTASGSHRTRVTIIRALETPELEPEPEEVAALEATGENHDCEADAASLTHHVHGRDRDCPADAAGDRRRRDA